VTVIKLLLATQAMHLTTTRTFLGQSSSIHNHSHRGRASKIGRRAARGGPSLRVCKVVETGTSRKALSIIEQQEECLYLEMGTNQPMINL